MKRRLATWWAGLLMAGAVVTSAAVWGGPKIMDYQVKILPTDSLASDEIPVDIVGVTQQQREVLESTAVKDWWESELRKSVQKVTGKVMKGKSWELQASDPIWQKWKDRGVIAVVVFADLPGDHPAAKDPRRAVASLDEKLYDTGKIKELGKGLGPQPKGVAPFALEFELTSGWVTLTTPLKPAKK